MAVYKFLPIKIVVNTKHTNIPRKIVNPKELTATVLLKHNNPNDNIVVTADNALANKFILLLFLYEKSA